MIPLPLPSGRVITICLALVPWAVLAAPPAQAQTAPPPGVDRIVLANGNVVDGEVLGLQRGKLQFDTDAMDEVSVDWDDVLSVTSDLIFEVTDIGGQLHYGSLDADGQDRVLVVRLGDDVVRLPYGDVIELRSLAERFWSRTAGYVDLNADLTRANAMRSLNLSWRFGYEGRIWEADLDGQAYLQSQETTSGGTTTKTETSRSGVSLEGRRNIDGRWAVTTSGSTERNEELSLERRNLFAVGLRYNIVRNQWLDFYAGSSGVFNSERFAGQGTDESGELKVTAGFDMFDLGDIDVYTLLETYTSRGFERFRVNINGRVAWEIVNDFTLGLNVIERYDSGAVDGTKRDFQYGFSVGWTWG